MSYIHYNNLDYNHMPKESLGKFFLKVLNSRSPNSIINIDAITGEFLSSKKCLEDSMKLTYYFKKVGLKKGDRIGIVSENTLNYCVPLLACFYSGVVVCPINPTYTLNELLHALSYSKPKLIFCSELSLATVLKAQEKTEFIHEILLLNKPTSEDIQHNYFDKALETIPKPINFKPENVDYIKDDAIILMSSGTTGSPKGILLNQQGIRQCIGYFSDISLGGVSSSEVTLHVTPMFHILGLLVQLFSIACFVKVVLLNKFKPDIYLRSIQDHKVTKLFAVPPLVVFLAKTPLTQKFDISSIKDIIVGGAPLSITAAEEVYEKAKYIKIYQVYGMTEMGGIITIQSRHQPIKPGSVGTVPPGISAKVCDVNSGLPLKPLETGELCFKSTGMMKGYISNNGLNADCFDEDGFYHTGDLGYYDYDNNFFIIDRIKELIKYKGFQVAPAELEDIIVSHPDVKDCGVTGIPDERAGELPLAFVVKKEKTNVTEEDIVKFVAERISVQKQLYGGVKFIKEIPKTSSGKILRKELKLLVENCEE